MKIIEFIWEKTATFGSTLKNLLKTLYRFVLKNINLLIICFRNNLSLAAGI